VLRTARVSWLSAWLDVYYDATKLSAVLQLRAWKRYNLTKNNPNRTKMYRLALALGTSGFMQKTGALLLFLGVVVEHRHFRLHFSSMQPPWRWRLKPNQPLHINTGLIAGRFGFGLRKLGG
jgi:hypothetical protein